MHEGPFAVPEQLEVARAPMDILRRRTQFFVRYLNAKARSRTLARLAPIVRSSFDHPWVTGVELRIQFWPGRERSWARLWPELLPDRTVHWDAPITVAILRKRKGKERQALCMSFYFRKRTLHIAQLQGIPGTDPPKELRFWPIKFIEACQTLAREENLEEVTVPRADTLYSYRSPTLNPELSVAARDQAVERIRTAMELLYDANARALGFVPDGDSFKWENSGTGARLTGSVREPDRV
jgi:hypothetical protein